MTQQGSEQGPLILILDVYRAHLTDDVKEFAKARHIELLFVPPGCTSLYQPLDRRVFGELKAAARREFNRLDRLTIKKGEEFRTSVGVLARCWKAITPENIRKAWKIDYIQS